MQDCKSGDASILFPAEYAPPVREPLSSHMKARLMVRPRGTAGGGGTSELLAASSRRFRQAYVSCSFGQSRSLTRTASVPTTGTESTAYVDSIFANRPSRRIGNGILYSFVRCTKTP